MPLLTTRSAKSYGLNQYVSLGTSGYFSIASAVVDASGQATFSFSAIPQTYTHLQIRATCQSNYGYTVDDAFIQFNGDTGNNYGYHNWYGAAPLNSTININQNQNTDGIDWAQSGGIGTTAVGQWGLAVIDILDYTSTSKKKSIRATTGMSTNSAPYGLGGRVGNAIGLWNNTAAINEIRLYASAGRPFLQHSVFSLYGIK